MVDDILLTPEEQDERAKKWLKDNGPALIIGVVLGLGAVFGYNSYKDNQRKAAEQASSLYDTVINLVQDSELADIGSQVSTLKSDHASTSYAAKAALLRAKQLAASDLDAALVELRWVSDNAAESGLVHTARLREAKILIAQDKLDAAKTIADTEPYDGFDSHYNELLADIAVRQNDYSVAKTHYQIAIDALGQADAAYQSVLSLKMNRLTITKVEAEEASATSENEANVAAPEKQTEAAEDDAQ